MWEAQAGDRGLTPGSERSPGGGSGNPPSILTWSITWTEAPGTGFSPWGHKELDMTEHTHTCTHTRKIFNGLYDACQRWGQSTAYSLYHFKL